MRKLAALVEFIIKELNFVAAENVDSFHVVDVYKQRGDFVFNAEQMGVCFYDQEYRAVISIERFPAKRYAPELVFSLVACWLLANDPELYRMKIQSNESGELIPLDDVDINTEQEDNDTLRIEIIVPFREPVFGVADDDGAFIVNDRNYRLADPSMDEEQFEQNYIRSMS